jgi:hypothetical protein
MKSFLLKLLPYLLAFIVINLNIYNNSHFYKQKERYTTQIDSIINNKPKTIFLGDSHPKTVELLNLSNNVGNMAFGADGINEMYIKTLILDKYNEDLECVFITTEAQIFNNSISSNSTFLNKYLLEINAPKEIYNKSTLNLITEHIPLFNDNYLRYFLNSTYFKLRNGLNKKNDENEGKKWSELSDLKRKNNAIQTGKQDHTGIMTSNKDLETYKDIIKKLKSKNIKIIGIRFPVSPHYLAQCNKEDLYKVNNFVNSIEYDYFLDYSSSLEDKSFYKNEDHLNRRGMIELSNLIFKDTGIKLVE